MSSDGWERLGASDGWRMGGDGWGGQEEVS